MIAQKFNKEPRELLRMIVEDPDLTILSTKLIGVTRENDFTFTRFTITVAERPDDNIHKG